MTGIDNYFAPRMNAATLPGTGIDQDRKRDKGIAQYFLFHPLRNSRFQALLPLG
jgi:hypothetical protein